MYTEIAYIVFECVPVLLRWPCARRIAIYERINDMYQKQKEKAFELLKNNEKNRDYTNRYWIPYADYLDPTDCFPTFSCDYLDGKQRYLDLIDNLLRADQTAKVFVELYGCDSFDGKPCINAETLILFSRLPLCDIEHIFNAPEDTFPSAIGEETDLSQPTFIIDENGCVIPAADLPTNGCSVYYCWWD